MNTLPHIIIDAYNLLHAIPSLHSRLAHDPRGAREELVAMVARLTHRRKFRATLVFDGSRPRDERPEPPHSPIHVVFASPLTADAKIREAVEKAKNRALLTIVSSDHEVLNHARVCACTTHSARHFANLLAEEPESAQEKADSALSQREVDEWLKIFGGKSKKSQA